jgi:glycosyltransferase involved in cell wall biosynthesis
MKILHLISQRPDSTGSGIYIQAMLRQAQARGHRNHLVAGIQAERRPELEGVGREQCSFVRFGGEDISDLIVGMSDVMPYRSRRFCDLGAEALEAYEDCFAGLVQTVAARFRPDLVHSHHLWILTSLARRTLGGLPVVATCHGSDLRQFENCRHLRERVLAGCRRLNAVMALSRAQKSDVERLYGLPPQRVHVVGAGYNDRLFFPAAKPESGPVRMLYAGKLSRAKGVPWLLRVLAGLDSPDWRLHLVGGGSGSEKADCLRLARNLGGRVQIHGALEQPRLAALMRQCHLFVLPSFYEGLPLVVLEALACGCRVIANDLPGVREVLGDLAVDFIDLVAPPRLVAVDAPLAEDEAAFADRLARAVRRQARQAVRKPQIDPERLAQKLSEFSWGAVFERVEGVYRQALRDAGRLP